MKGFWTCQRRKNNQRCGHLNPMRKQLCERCGGRRPARRRALHMSALDVPYEHYLSLNGGEERCGICGAEPKPGKRLHRDHDHQGVGKPRGLLCFRCNSALRPYMTLEWLRAATAYVERAMYAPDRPPPDEAVERGRQLRREQGWP